MRDAYDTRRRSYTADPEFRRSWPAALRSGKYKQCRGRLHDGDSFCVMGVLYDLVQKKYPKLVNAATEDPCILSSSVRELAGLNGLDGSLPEGMRGRFQQVLRENTEVSLTTLNDAGLSFTELAKIIEEPRCHVFWT